MAQKLYRGRKQRETFNILKEEMTKRAEIERASKERAKAKQQREEQERTSRAVAGVNHLEIPAELAFIYSKLDGTFLSEEILRQCHGAHPNLQTCFIFFTSHSLDRCIYFSIISRLATHAHGTKSPQGRRPSHSNEL